MATNILPFDPNLANALPDSEYHNDNQRQNGIPPGSQADSSLHNKLFAQVSAAAVAVATFVSDGGYDALDRDPEGMAANFRQTIIDLLNSAISTRVPDVRASESAYKVGDCVTAVELPLWGELECITAGTSGSGGLTLLPETDSRYGIGMQLTDGSVVWAVRAKRLPSVKNTPFAFRGEWKPAVIVGGVITEPALPIHSETGLPMWDCRFCDGTNSTVDMRGRMIRGKQTIEASDAYGGSDSVTLTLAQMAAHVHTGVVASAGGHIHAATASSVANHSHTYTDIYLEGSTQGFQWGAGGEQKSHSLNTGASGGHTHTLTVSSSGVHTHALTTDSSGQNAPITIIPSHYALTYIQRIY